MAIGSIILATDYNLIQEKVQQILGIGQGRYGYGQVVRSSPVDIGEVITEVHWLNLMYDVHNVNLHQTGTIPTTEVPSTTKSIKYRSTSPNFGLDTIITETEPTKFSIAGSRSTISAIASVVSTNEWLQSAKTTLTATFADPNQARNFFNAGAKIRIRTSRTAGNDTYQNRAWSDVLSTANVQTLQAIASNSSTVGFYSLTDQWQTLYISTGSSIYSSLYSMNYYVIKVKCNIPDNSEGGATIIDFSIELIDLHLFNNAGTGPFKIPPTSPLYKDKVDGILTISIEQLADISSIQPAGTWDTVNPIYTLSEIVLDGP